MEILKQVTQLVRGQSHTLVFAGSIPAPAPLCLPAPNVAPSRYWLGAVRAINFTIHTRRKKLGSQKHTTKSPTQHGRGWPILQGAAGAGQSGS